ncbi:MAG: SDR family oxidoreductase [Actinomycetota bacterium]
MGATARSVLVTGSSTGVGAACVDRLARSGWRVVAGVRRDEDADRISSTVRDALPLHLDVTDGDSIAAAVERIDEEVGRLDAVVNNAGIVVSGPVELLDVDDWREQFEVNLFGLVAVTRATMPLVDRVGGRYVHIGSIAARISTAGLSPYSASKHAVSALNWALREELQAIGTMTSTVIEPGEVATPIWDKGRAQLTELEARLDGAGLTGRYGWLVDNFRAFVAEAVEHGIDPDRVARVVERALTARRPRARYVVGADARAMAVAARLPDRARELLSRRLGDRYVRQGRAMT